MDSLKDPTMDSDGDTVLLLESGLVDIPLDGDSGKMKFYLLTLCYSVIHHQKLLLISQSRMYTSSAIVIWDVFLSLIVICKPIEIKTYEIK